MKLNPIRMKNITQFLVQINSVVGTDGEAHIMEELEKRILENPYFQDHDSYMLSTYGTTSEERTSLLAMVRGEKEKNDKTIILLGHLDTVGISDYGPWEDFATKPEDLMATMKEDSLPKEIQDALSSGEYLFGRGTLDMKAGVAIMLHILETLIQNRADFSGQVVCAFVTDEEANSKGMLSAVPLLLKLKKSQNLNYQVAIDTDYTSERTLGDPNRYLYAGTVGKLMPSFFIVGKETHVGDPFGGLDPNEIASSILSNINLNLALCDHVDGEVTVPPISLHLMDLKKEYSVQTAKSTSLYFNYATHDSSPSEVLEKLEPIALEAFQSVVEKLNKSYTQFTKLMGLPAKNLPWFSRVLTYDILYKKVCREVPNLDNLLEDYTKTLMAQGTFDEREISLALVQKLHSLWSDQNPVVILYFSPPYYPHVSVTGKTDKEERLLRTLEQLQRPEDKNPLILRKFYPYISDLSYFSMPADNMVNSLVNNMPGFGTSYTLPLEEIQSLNLPVANIGPYGYDAHKSTERLLLPYSFEQVPSMILETIFKILEK